MKLMKNLMMKKYNNQCQVEYIQKKLYIKEELIEKKEIQLK